MNEIKKILLVIGVICSLMIGYPFTAGAVDIADYTAFPPFLPRIVSPNILFLLDYSKSMVRPAYGACTTLTGLSDCRFTFSNLSYDYDSATTYSGYFDTTSGSSKYNCTSTLCAKNSLGVWNGNFLNWLTTTQFDIMKKVTVGGDIDPAPEQGNPTKMRSILTSGYTFRKTVNLPNSGNSTSCSSTDTPDCVQWPTLTYNWIDASSGGTHIFGSAAGDAFDLDDFPVRSVILPFSFTFYGNTYTTLYISINGFIGFTNSNMNAFSNQDMPNAFAGYPDNFIAPFWDDLYIRLDPDVNKTSRIMTVTKGSAPNRIFVISYDPVYHIADIGKADPLRFQILLYEGSNHIAFQYKDVRPGTPQFFGGAKSATIGVENIDGTGAKKFSFCTSCGVNVLTADGTTGQVIFAAPHASYTITPTGGQASTTLFQPAMPLTKPVPAAYKSGVTPIGPYKPTTDSDNDFSVLININSVAGAPNCPSGSYLNKDRNTCYDHETVGLLQDFRDGELGGTLGFRLAIMQLNGSASVKDGGTVKKHFNEKDTTGWSSLMTATRGQTPTTVTPLAEALQIAEGYFKQDTTFNMGLTTANSWTNDGVASACVSTGNNFDPYCFQSAAQRVACCKSFVLVVSSGNYSNDNRTNIYGDPADADGQLIAGAWRTTDEIPGNEGTQPNGGWLDNVAYKTHTTDWRTDLDGTQSLTIYAVNTFGAGSGDGTAVLKKAAKYGGFEDVDGDGNYDSTGAFDCTDPPDGTKETGEDDKNCNGNPDTYFEATGGSDIKSQIISAVADILKSSASGTTVSVLSTSASGEGAVYQAYFYPAKTEGTTDERTWPGFLRAFFLDKFQNLRADDNGGSSSDAKLVLTNDRIIEMFLDTAADQVKINLFVDSDGDGTKEGSPTTVLMDSVTSIWEGGKKLALRDKSLRKIYTWVDLNSNSLVDNGDFNSLTGEAIELINTAGNRSTLKSYLRAGDPDGLGLLTADDEAGNIIDFMRGNAVGGYRNRCISITGASAETGCTGNQRVWTLGDIVYSTPTLVSGPGERFDEIYGDADYRTFRNKYKSRRSVVYVGANDGMLHAFNGGVFTSGDNCTGTATAEVESGCFAENPPPADDGWGVGIGDELWAFVPHDNLPHLAWLACNGTSGDPTACNAAEYTHVYYVDQRPKVTDARIFTPDTTHPGGWGTILIMGMRFGGGAIDVDINGDTLITGTESFRSAFYLFDITNPEQKPKLLWRFYNSGLGFTSSYPAIARIKSGTTEKWYMVVGSGPTNTTTSRDYGSKSTTQAGKLFVIDLNDGSLDKTITMETGNTFMGDPIVVDADLDFGSDVIYVGSAISTTSGRIYRINTKGGFPDDLDTTTWVKSTLFDPNPSLSNPDPDVGNDAGPLLVAPSVSKDSVGNIWIFFGTGRLRHSDDLTNSDQQRFYGIKDACWNGSCTTTYNATTDLFNSSGIVVKTATGGTQVCYNADCTQNSSFTGLIGTIRNDYKGWFVDLSNPVDPQPSERVLSRSVVLGGLLLFTTYTPAGDICSTFGDGSLYALYYETGSAYSKDVIGTEMGTGALSGTKLVSSSLSLGKGMPTSVGVAIGETVTGFVQKSTGEIVRVQAEPGLSPRSEAEAWREKSGAGGTVEIEEIYKHIVK